MHHDLMNDVPEADNSKDSWDAVVHREASAYLARVDLSPEPILIHRDSWLVHANPAAAALIGSRQPQELLGQSIFNFIHPDYRQFMLERARLTEVRGHVAQRSELPIRRQDGSYIDCELLVVPITFGGVNYYQAFLADISERKRNEAALRYLVEVSNVLSASLELPTTLTLLARLIVPEIADACIIDLIDGDTIVQAGIKASDPAIEALLHIIVNQHPPLWASPQLVGRVVRQARPVLLSAITDEVLVSITDGPEHAELMRQIGVRSAIGVPLIAREQLLGAITLLNIRSDRQYDQVDLQIATELGRRAAAAADNARLYREAHTAIAHEQAARKRAERAEQRQSLLAKTATTLATSLDFEERLTQLGQVIVPAFAHYCVIDVIDEGKIRRVAASHRDPNMKPLLTMLQQRYPADWNTNQPAARALRTGMPHHGSVLSPSSGARNQEHLDLLAQLGTYAWLAVPLKARGRTLGAITFVRSADDAAFSEEDQAVALELGNRAALGLDNARLYHESQQAVLARDQFLSVASHELKTPLTTLLGNAQLLERRQRDAAGMNERDRRTIKLIIDQARRLNRMVVALLDLSRSANGQLTLDSAPIDLGNLVQRMANEQTVAAEEHELRLHLPKQSLIVYGDELRLEQVLQNLIQNAIKYSPHGGPVDVALEAIGNVARLTVVDRGIGIPANAQPKLFQRFFRAGNSENQRITGMGIGLYVVRQIVTLHGGEVSVQSTEGQGSTFTVTLPLNSIE